MRQLKLEEIERIAAAVPVYVGRSSRFRAALANGNCLDALECVPRRLVDEAEGGAEWTYQPRRLAFLAQISEYLDPSEYGHTLRVVWTTTEKFVDEAMFQTLFDWTHPGAALTAATAAERSFLASLPDPFPVYRGCTASTRDGYCWTTARQVAEGFAATHSAENEEPPEVLTRMCPTAAVRAIYHNAGEFEIVVNYEDLIKH